jgi:hypothetical protein
MTDVVRYTLPFGILGRIVHAVKVRDDVRRIFDYRYQRIEELFANPPSAAVIGAEDRVNTLRRSAHGPHQGL